MFGELRNDGVTVQKGIKLNRLENEISLASWVFYRLPNVQFSEHHLVHICTNG
jgi:hypothetical protein